MERRGILVISALLSGIATTLALLVLVPGQAAAAGSVHYVAPNCTDVPVPCHTTVQGAVDAARDGDVVKVASGIYASVNTHPYRDDSTSDVITQVVYLEKSIAIKGGYTIANWTAPDPEANPTTLDALGQGRVLYVVGDPSAGSGQAITPTIRGLRIIGGDASGLGGGVERRDAGGGMYVTAATATISDNQVLSNTAMVGGGLYFQNSNGTRLTDNLISGNGTLQGGYGGGLYFENSADVRLTGI